MHRDLKLANILISADNSLRVIDFGLAFVIPKLPRPYFKEVVGSLLFMAPEIIKEQGAETCYTHAVDIWSLGVMMYYLLAGTSPFRGDTDEEFSDSIKNDLINFRKNERIAKSSDQARDLIEKMCEKNPIDRISTEQALTHPFFA